MTENNADSNPEKTIQIDEVGASLFQIFSQYHCLTTTQLEKFLEMLRADWGQGSTNDLDWKVVFKRMNKRLNAIGFEIKTVAIPCSNNNSSSSSSSSHETWEYYHGLVNTREDFVSTELGNVFTPLELKFFHLLTLRLVMFQQLSTSDVLQLKSLDTQAFGKLLQADIHELLNRLEQDMWIQRNDRGYYILAPRTFLELQSYLDGAIREGQILGLEEFTEVERTNAIKSLPSLIMY